MRGPGREVRRGNEEKEMNETQEGQVMNELTVDCQLESFSGWW